MDPKGVGWSLSIGIFIFSSNDGDRSTQGFTGKVNAPLKLKLGGYIGGTNTLILQEIHNDSLHNKNASEQNCQNHALYTMEAISHLIRKGM